MISHAKFHCSRLTTVQDIQDYASLIFGTQCRLILQFQCTLHFVCDILNGDGVYCMLC